MTSTRRGTLPVGAARVLRDWRAKAFLQKVLCTRQKLNYLLQRRVTLGVPIDDARLDTAVEQARAHIQAYENHATGTAPLLSANFFEFGAGWDLHLPVLWRPPQEGSYDLVASAAPLAALRVLHPAPAWGSLLGLLVPPARLKCKANGEAGGSA